MPIHYAVYTYISELETYWWPLNREVQIHSATSLVWVIMIGYALSTIIMFVPWKDPYTAHIFISLRQPSPMFIRLICGILKYFQVKRNGFTQVPRKVNQDFPKVLRL